MSEETTNVPTPEEEFEEFVQFMRAKKSEVKCELCGNEDFMAVTQQNGMIPQIYWKSSDRISGSSTTPCIMATCINCGNTKFFLKHIIDMWRRSSNG